MLLIVRLIILKIILIIIIMNALLISFLVSQFYQISVLSPKGRARIGGRPVHGAPSS